LGNLILGIIKLAQPGRCCRSEKQEKQTRSGMAIPALYKSHLHSQVAGVTLRARVSTSLGIPPSQSNRSTWLLMQLPELQKEMAWST